MHLEAGMPDEPVLDGGRLVRAVVVHHEVDVQPGWHVGLDGAQELQELAAAMPTMEVPDDGAGGNVQRCKQRRRAVALVVMGAPLRDPGARGSKG